SSSQAPTSSAPVNTTSSAPSSTPSSYDPFEFDPCLPYNGTYTTSTGETYQVRSFTDNNYASYNNTPAPNGPSDCFTICDTAGNCRGWTYARSGPPGSVGNCYLPNNQQRCFELRANFFDGKQHRFNEWQQYVYGSAHKQQYCFEHYANFFDGEQHRIVQQQQHVHRPTDKQQCSFEQHANFDGKQHHRI
ncbi:hypothetical protein KC318_g19859, partial [Hortaea werneckii]